MTQQEKEQDILAVFDFKYANKDGETTDIIITCERDMSQNIDRVQTANIQKFIDVVKESNEDISNVDICKAINELPEDEQQKIFEQYGDTYECMYEAPKNLGLIIKGKTYNYKLQEEQENTDE